MSRELTFFYDILLEFNEKVSDHAFTLRCLPQSFPGQRILDACLSIHPSVPYSLQKDCFGNLMQIGLIDYPHDSFRYTVRGRAQVDYSKLKPETAHPIFRFPSRYTALSSEMRSFLSSLALPTDAKEITWLLSEAVRSHMEYAPGVTGTSTTAAQAFSAGAGVCQDFAHIFLSLARECGLHARYVNGLPQGEGASHAWCEVFLSGFWIGIDPTRGKWTDEGYLRFGVGRDFGDCPIERGVFIGKAEQQQKVFMRVTQQ